MKTKCLIIGSGPAGYTAAIYTSRAGLDPVIFEGHTPGGQLTTTTEVENFPGYPEGVTGPQLMADLRKQAERFGADIHSGRIAEVDFSSRPFRARPDGGEWIEADTVIIATGASAMYLGLPDEAKYAGLGVSACATCDGFFYRKKRVAVAGGGDTACEEALYLSTPAEKVYLLVRKPHLRASKVMQQRVAERENIEIMFNTNTVGLYGEEFLEGIHLVEHVGTPDERRFDLAVDGFFLGIGHKPETEIFKPFIKLDDHGYIKTFNSTTVTSVNGIFAAGDVADPRYRQAISAAGMGCRAALDAEAFILENPA